MTTQPQTFWAADTDSTERALRQRIAELERLCDATYVAQGADAYNHATTVMAEWQAARVLAGRDPGCVGSLCDGLARLQEMIEQSEARAEELARENAALRAESTIEWKPFCSYTAADLLRRAIRGIRARRNRALWPAVENLCGVGSTVARHLCRWAGRDPDTGADLNAARAARGEG